MSHACSGVRQALATVFKLVPPPVSRVKSVIGVRHAPTLQRLFSSTCRDRHAADTQAILYIRRGSCCPRSVRTASFSSSPRTSARNPAGKRKRHSRNDDARLTIDHALSHDFRSIFPGVAGAVSAADGALIVRTLHTRRVDGSLAELGVRIDSLPPTVPDKALVQALAWLRAHHPVDERAAADAYAVREADRLERELAGTSAGATASRPGTSVIEEFKRFHEERRAREAREEEERKKDAPVLEEALPPAHVVEAQRKVEMRRQRNAEWKEYYRERAVVSQATEPPEMSNWARLVPSTILGLSLLGGFIFMSEMYTPPQQSSRWLPDTPASVATIAAIAGINAIVFVLWRFPPAQRLLNMYALQVPAYPYALSIIGNVFSHQSLAHVTANMAGLALYGISVHEDVGRGTFMAIFLAGGVAGSLTSLYTHVLRRHFHTSANGASGGIWAIMLAWAYLNLNKPARSPESSAFARDVALYAILATQVLVHFVPQVGQRIDIAAHVGGAATGLAWAYVLQRQALSRPQVVPRGASAPQGADPAGSDDARAQTQPETGMQERERTQLERKMAEAAKANAMPRFVGS